MILLCYSTKKCCVKICHNAFGKDQIMPFWSDLLFCDFSCNTKADMLWTQIAKWKCHRMKKTEAHINAFLGKDTDFEGKLTFSGTVRVDGLFKGEIVTEGTLIVGEKAVIQSDIHTSSIVIKGEVRGNIFAANRIEMLAPGKVFGNIHAPTITMDEGALFNGNCHMKDQGPKVDKKVAVLP
jgi:cytoskeletal protein CcmA (bactofilin family)